MALSAAESILDLIGRTPAVELNRITRQRKLNGRLVVKIESVNPGGSKKDRVALEAIRSARAEHKLMPGQAVVEVTSGNTGAGLAIVCQAMGHPFYAVMSRGNTLERAQMMAALGATVVLVDQVDGTAGRVTGSDMKAVQQRARELVVEMDAYFVDQFENPSNSRVHERTTGPELWEQCGGKLDAIVAFAGSGGALAGMARHLRTVNPALRVYVVEPSEASSLAKCTDVQTGHAIQGGGYGRRSLTLMKDIAITGYRTCTDSNAESAARALARDEGILAGYSTGAQLHVALELLAGPESGSTIGFLACDSGMKYFSTPLYALEKLRSIDPTASSRACENFMGAPETCAH